MLEAGPARALGKKCPPGELREGRSVRRAVRWDCIRGGDRRRNGETGVLGCEEQECCCQEREVLPKTL